MGVVADLHADLDRVGAGITAAYTAEAVRLREVASDPDLIETKRWLADLQARALASKLESIGSHIPTLHMLIDNLHRDYPEADTTAAVAAPKES